MPKYYDKMRLKKLLLKNSQTDPLVRYLILNGYSNDIVETWLVIICFLMGRVNKMD